MIDTSVDALGVLLIHKRMQVRFYQISRTRAERWPETEIYSFDF